MKIALLGPRGMVGRAFCHAFADHEVVPLDRGAVDLEDLSSVRALELSGCDWVVNCAGYTDVDGAEAHEPRAELINGIAVGELAKRCAEQSVRLVHLSTDYVFDGESRVPYAVDATRQPINAYGRSKRLGEEAIEASMVDALVVRTSWVYAPWGRNFVRTMAQLTRSRERLMVVHDQRGRPTSAPNLARTVRALMVDHDAQGTFHVTDGGESTWCELAMHVSEQVGGTARIEPCATEQYPTRATRPSYSVLDLSGTEALVGPMTPWREAVAAVAAELEPS